MLIFSLFSIPTQIETSSFFSAECVIVISNLVKHVQLKHNVQMGQVCHVCGEGFISHSRLVKHMHHVHSETNKHSCISCDYKAKSNSNLKSHMKRQHNLKVAVHCKFCFEKYYDKVVLRNHMLSSHKDKYKAECGECGYKFLQKSYLSAHKKEVHGGSRPFGCALCAKEYPRIQSLVEHISKVHCASRSICIICNKHVQNNVTLELHITTYHCLCVSLSLLQINHLRLVIKLTTWARVPHKSTTHTLNVLSPHITKKKKRNSWLFVDYSQQSINASAGMFEGVFLLLFSCLSSGNCFRLIFQKCKVLEIRLMWEEFSNINVPARQHKQFCNHTPVCTRLNCRKNFMFILFFILVVSSQYINIEIFFYTNQARVHFNSFLFVLTTA